MPLSRSLLLTRVKLLDWAEGGWNADETVRVSKLLKELGVDVVDCSTGGAVLNAQVSPAHTLQFRH